MNQKKKYKNIIVGVCGGISAYKSCQLVRLLVKQGHSVRVVMTEAATKFVSPLVFQTLSKHPVFLEMFRLYEEQDIRHVSVAQWASVCVIAPLSANTLAKIALGICDNLLTTTVAALNNNIRVVFAPAMNENMWKNPLVQENVRKIKGIKKYLIISPKIGELACGVYGEGRMAEPEEILKAVLKG